MTPYAAPRSESSATEKVDVDVNRALPSVCLKCGATADVSPRPENLNVFSDRARVITIVVVLGVIAAVCVFDSIELRVTILIALAIAVRLLFMALRPVLRKVDIRVPLCASCNDRWSSGIKRNRIYRALILFFCICMLLAIVMTGSPFAAVPFFPPVIALNIANVVLRLRSRVVLATARAGDVVTLSGIAPDAVSAIRAGRRD
jgi:hypothetical protein